VRLPFGQWLSGNLDFAITIVASCIDSGQLRPFCNNGTMIPLFGAD
jgi:hypothetical protein